MQSGDRTCRGQKELLFSSQSFSSADDIKNFQAALALHRQGRSEPDFVERAKDLFVGGLSPLAGPDDATLHMDVGKADIPAKHWNAVFESLELLMDTQHTPLNRCIRSLRVSVPKDVFEDKSSSRKKSGMHRSRIESGSDEDADAAGDARSRLLFAMKFLQRMEVILKSPTCSIRSFECKTVPSTDNKGQLELAACVGKTLSEAATVREVSLMCVREEVHRVIRQINSSGATKLPFEKFWLFMFHDSDEDPQDGITVELLSPLFARCDVQAIYTNQHFVFLQSMLDILPTLPHLSALGVCSISASVGDHLAPLIRSCPALRHFQVFFTETLTVLGTRAFCVRSVHDPRLCYRDIVLMRCWLTRHAV